LHKKFSDLVPDSAGLPGRSLGGRFCQLSSCAGQIHSAAKRSGAIMLASENRHVSIRFSLRRLQQGIHPAAPHLRRREDRDQVPQLRRQECAPACRVVLSCDLEEELIWHSGGLPKNPAIDKSRLLECLCHPKPAKVFKS